MPLFSIVELKHDKGIVTKYRELQGLQLTEIGFRILEAITPEKISNSSFYDLIRCFYILDKAKRAIEGKGRLKITGLIGYLMQLEKEEKDEPES